MSDITWVALIIIVYMLVIKPMMQGMVKKSGGTIEKQNPQRNKASKPEGKPESYGNDYVDYEEVK
jgi:hypothetical protein